MKDIKFELGQWVGTENGYGQIMYIRPYFVEDYENDRKGRKNGEFIQFIYVCKILCGFDGKIKKSKRINIYTSISQIDKDGLVHLKDIRENQKKEYEKYILYDDKISIYDELFVKYKLDIVDYDKEFVEKQIKQINIRLYPAFTYKEFIKVFKEYDFPFQSENIVQYGHNISNYIELRFDSNLYKIKDKEVVFDNVKVIRS